MTDTIRRAFLKLGVTQGFVAWLLLKSAVASPPSSTKPPDINQWLATLPHATIRFWLLAPQAFGLILGMGAMAGALSYSGAAPVNLWIILLLFAFLPLLMTIASFIKVALSLFKGQQTGGRGLITSWLQQLFSKHLPVSTTAFISRTGDYWLLFRLQAMGIAFQTGAMVCFVTILLFKDVAFGWSSTLIKSPDSVAAFFNYFSLPWQSLLGAPTLELITQSQFFYHQGTPTATSTHWWPHLLFALFFYGLVPRVGIWYWLNLLTAKRFTTELDNSSAIAQFFNTAQIGSHAAKLPPSDELLPTLDIAPAVTLTPKTPLLNWQQPHSPLAIHTLGAGSWQDDEQWLHNYAAESTPVNVAVSEQQTPTAECSDLLSLLPKPVQLILLVKNSEPMTRAIRSWQYFANENNYSLILARNIQTQEAQP